MLVSKEGNLVTLINVFETTPEQQQALIGQWTHFTEEIKEEPGVIGIALHETISLYWSDSLSQIGGHPEWVQSPDYPFCPDCDSLMTFIAQLGLTDVDPGHEGMIYAFLCSACGTATTRCQST